jgi:hypothetical protein
LVGETEKSRVGTTIMLFLVKDSLVKKEVWDYVLSCCNSQFFCSQSSQRSTRTFSCIRCKMSQ